MSALDRMIPSERIASVDVPRLFLGDHGYLSKLDSCMSVEQVTASMVRMLGLAHVGLSAGERRVLDAAMAARRATGASVPLMIHGDLLVRLPERRIRYRYCAATTVSALAQLGLDVSRDAVLGFLPRVAVDARPLTPTDVKSLLVDSDSLQCLTSDVLRARPALVTVGGDWLDMLLLLGRQDLIVDGLGRLVDSVAEVGAALILTTYVGALMGNAELSQILGMIDGVMAPLNYSGSAMLPDPDSHRAWIQRLELPVVAMHVLSGSPDVATALRCLDHAPVTTAVVGASTAAHQETLARAAALYFQGAEPWLE